MGSAKLKWAVGTIALAVSVVGLTAEGIQVDQSRVEEEISSVFYAASTPGPVVEYTEESPRISDSVPLDDEMQSVIITYCDEYGVPISLVLGVIETESSFVETASNGRCYGLMQISSINQPWLADSIGVTDIYDTQQNLQAGIYMLGDLYEKYEDWSMALIAYNCGETGARRSYFSRGTTTSTYSEKVLAKAEAWSEILSRC